MKNRLVMRCHRAKSYCSRKSSADTGEEPATVESSAAEILATSAPSLASRDRADATQIPDLVDQNEPESAQNEPEVHQEEPAVEYPAYFEPKPL